MTAIDCAVRESRRRCLFDHALAGGRMQSWDFQPFKDDLEVLARNPSVRP
jgi:hypothetical protein